MRHIYRKYCKGGRECHHQLSFNGLPLRVARRSRFSNPSFSQTVIDDVIDSIDMKGVPSVLDLHHWPCGWGHSKKIPCCAGMRICFMGKDDVRHECLKRQLEPMPIVRMGMHIDASSLAESISDASVLPVDDILFVDRPRWMAESRPDGILGAYYESSREEYILRAA